MIQATQISTYLSIPSPVSLPKHTTVDEKKHLNPPKDWERRKRELFHIIRVRVTKQTQQKLEKERKLELCYPVSASGNDNNVATVRAVSTDSYPRIQAIWMECMVAWQTDELISFHETLETNTAVLWFSLRHAFLALIRVDKDLQVQLVQCILGEAWRLLHASGSRLLGQWGWAVQVRARRNELDRHFSFPVACIC